MRQKNLYIVLTRTSTILSRLISRVTGDSYTHASVSLDKDLSVMYSFGRKRVYDPLRGGFCRENLNEGVFAFSKTLPYVVIQIKLTDAQYRKAESLLNAYSRNAADYHYNYAGLFLARFGRTYKCSRRFYCSEFVLDLLRQCEISGNELPSAVRPQSLIQCGEIVQQGDWRLCQANANANNRPWPHIIYRLMLSRLASWMPFSY